MKVRGIDRVFSVFLLLATLIISIICNIADNLDKYCWDFAADWVWHGPEKNCFLHEFGNGQLGAVFGAPDVVDYLNRWAFPEHQSRLIKGLGCYDYEIPEEYKHYPKYNF